MTMLRYAKGGLLAALAAGGFAFGGVPPKEPPKDQAKRPATAAAPTTSTSASTSASTSVVTSSSEKKCPYSTQECLNYMAARLKASGWIGIEYDPDKGNEISRIIPGSPAEKSGLLPGDHLFALNGVEIKKENQEALAKARKEWSPGQTVRYTVKHDGLARQVDIVLAPWPADVLARYIGEHMLQHAEADAAALNSPR